jgi:hypothetical protein
MVTHVNTSTAAFSADYPALAKMALTEEDFTSLRDQGFVSQELVKGKSRYKLRFRRPGGRQVVRYIRPVDVEAVQVDLANLQTVRRDSRELRHTTRLGREVLRDAKTRATPLLAELGLRFHGRAIRRPRG